jgi:hypothetical protein
MTTLTNVRISSLVNTMSTHQWEEWKVVEKSTCNCFHPTWKLASHAIATKVSWITSWVPIHSLPLAQHKRWALVTLMGCVHTHQRISAINGCGNPSRVWSVMEKDEENIRKVNEAGKVGQTISQMPTPRLEHDKIRTRWVSHILSKSMLERIWWCKRSKIEVWNCTICCPMNCSKGGRHAHVGGNRNMQATLKCCWKGMN